MKYPKLSVCIALFIIALALNILLIVPALFVALYVGIREKKLYSNTQRALFGAAHGLDVYANQAYPDFFNFAAIKRGGYHFGAQGETISSALGKNWTMGTCTVLGEGCTGLLNYLDTTAAGPHCYRYIQYRDIHGCNALWPFSCPPKIKGWKVALFSLVMAVIFLLAPVYFFGWLASSLTIVFILVSFGVARLIRARSVKPT